MSIDEIKMLDHTAIDVPPEEDQKNIVENDPTEYLPVMRHHLHEALWALNLALSFAQATDLADSYRKGSNLTQESHLARQLGRSHATLSGYLGLLDDEVSDGEVVSENE